MRLRMDEIIAPKHVELIEIINKITTVASSWLFILTCILYEENDTVVISRSFLVGMKNVSDKRCRENQNIHFVFRNFFLENRAI